MYGHTLRSKRTVFKILTLHNVMRLGVEEAPKQINLYANLSSSLDFDSIESCPLAQELQLTKDDVIAQKPVELKYVKFQNLNSLTVSVHTVV